MTRRRPHTAPRIAALLALVCAFGGCVLDDDAHPAADHWASYTLRGQGEVRIQQPVVAGRFYPADPGELKAEVRSLLDGSDARPPEGDVFGLIAPHSTLHFSGPVAADAYGPLAGTRYEVVVILAPSHYSVTPPVSVLDVDRYKTPMGTMLVDRPVTRALLADGIPYDHRTFGLEHSVEVQLPFIRAVFPGTPIVAVSIAQPDPALCRKLAGELDAALADRRALFVAASDLSHYHPHDVATRIDRTTLEPILRLDADGLFAAAEAREAEATGIGPIATLIELFKRRGGKRATLVRYANSGDTEGGRDRVVGYAAVQFLDGKQGVETMADPYLTEDEKTKLLAIARRTVEEFVRTGVRPDPDEAEGVLGEIGAAFVTLRSGGNLRGCIGHVIGREPLALSVRDMAVAAASEDPRFPPVTASELDAIDIEVSVLTPLEKVDDLESIVVGRDGLLIRQGYRQGLLLPQVPDEYGWDRQTFLEQTCLKAGLRRSAWKDERTEVLRFRAIVFQED